MQDENAKIGEEIIKSVTERLTLRMFRVGCDKSNYRILNSLPTTVETLMKEMDLSKMPINKRLNELESVGLVTRKRYEGKIEKTKLTTAFMNMINEVKIKIIKELPNLI